MAKRFTDSEKWKKFWFRKLKPEHKLFWIYILDNCDCAGVWETDFEIAEQFIGKKLNRKEVEKDFDDQILKIENNKWFIIDFIEFQYKKTVYELDPDNNAHKKAIFIVNKYDIKNKLKTKHSAPNISPSVGGDKDKEEEKEVDKEKEGGDFVQDLCDVFLEEYKSAKNIVYVTEKHDKKHMGELLGKIKKIKPDLNSEAMASSMRKLFKSCCNIRGSDDKFLSQISISFLNSQLNKYLNFIQNGNKNNGSKYNGVDTGKYKRLLDELDASDKLRQQNTA